MMLRPSASTRDAVAASTRRRPLALPARARKPSGSTTVTAAAADAADGAAPLAELSRRRSATVFASPALRRAALLARQQIDALFGDPRTLDTRRLLDPFYVPDQYNLLRTQPGALLGADAASAVTDALVEFGEQHLGLNSVTPPWISFYLDGMGQETHVDAFQGPLAFVLPLSWWGDEEDDDDASPSVAPRPRVFAGGETAILRHGVLRYWDGAEEEEEEGGDAEEQQQQQQQQPKKQRRRTKAKTTTTTAAPATTTTAATPIGLSGGSFRANQGQELDHLFARVPPRFGRLLVFDGRLPHGVRTVRCPTADPRDARIALHAWFAPPDGPFFSGALAEGGGKDLKKARAALDAVLQPLMQELAEECPPASGLLTARLRISGETGVVEKEVEWLSDTLVVSPGVCVDGGIGEREARALIQHVVRERLRGVRFPATGGAASTATVPLLFE